MASDPVPSAAPPDQTAIRFFLNPLTLWIGFFAVHFVVAAIALAAPGPTLGDVTTVYRPWVLQIQAGGPIVGIDLPWVYPIVALVPILIPMVFGAGNYVGSWLTFVLLLDAAAFAVLVIGGHRRNLRAAWWWLGFTLLLGPIALSRLDTVSVPLVLLGLLWLGQRPRLAAVLLTIATWIKVWPAAIVVALLVAARTRWRILLTAAVTSAVFVVAALLWGAGANVFSFVSAQADRGLQIEAPISTIWMWQAAAHRAGSLVYYDAALNTFQVTGDGIGEAISLMMPLLVIAVIAVLLIGYRAVHYRVSAARTIPVLSLGLVTAFIAFNKVGSPQYIVWLAAPIIVGLAWQGRAFRSPAILVAVIGALTQVFYPYLYNSLLVLNPVLLVVLTARNLLLFVVLGWAVATLWRSTRVEAGAGGSDIALTPVWPFSGSRGAVSSPGFITASAPSGAASSRRVISTKE